MLQVIFEIAITAIVLVTACIMFLCFNNTKFYGTILSHDLCCLLEKTPALNAFLMFVVQTILVVVAEACFFKRISNSIIISLDIIYFMSMLILVLYNSLKESRNLLMKVV